MVDIVGRRPSANVIDRRTAATSGTLAAAAGIVGLLGSAAASVGFAGIDATLCLFNVGECQATSSKVSELSDDAFANDPTPCARDRAVDLPSPAAVSAASTPPSGDCPPVMSDKRKERLKELVAVILGDTERVWTAVFAERGKTYQAPKLVLYDRAQKTKCGDLAAGSAPVYCRKDETIYMDFTFFDQAIDRYDATGDAIPAFIVAHEVAHHIQHLSGDFDRYLAARKAVETLGEDESTKEDTPNQLLVRLELQADCLAGVSAKRAQVKFSLLSPKDLEDAIKGATVLGDDNIQRAESGFINEAAFTHGSGKQRLKWLERGYTSGKSSSCNTWTIAFSDL
ncbi:MAG: neutral zinc metallopeptidase [Neomegalonema sp.]|nr:neutral zinc metallopeptidase [Neomegalonema sp.]